MLGFWEVGRLLSSSGSMVGWSWETTGVLEFWGVRGLLSSFCFDGGVVLGGHRGARALDHRWAITFNKKGNILRVGTSHKKS